MHGPALCLTLLPATALAAAPNGQVIYVGNVNVTNGGYWTTGNDGTVTAFTGEGTPTDNYIHYDTADNTLTLHNATIKVSVPSDTNTHVMGAGIGVFNQNGAAELTIALEGTNTIAEVDNGIYVLAFSESTVSSSLTITGDGSLDASVSQSGIKVQSNSGGATLEINSAEIKAVGGAYTSCSGVWVQAQNGSDVSLTVDGGSLTASGDTGICLLFGSSDSGSGTPSLAVSGNAIVRASGNAGGIASNASAATPSGTGIVFDGGTGTVYGSVTLQENITIDEGESLNIPEGSNLNTNGKLTVNGGTLNGTPSGDVTYKVTGVSLNKTSLTLDVGGSETLTAIITPDNATDKSVTWKSSASGVATVGASGLVTAVSADTAIITVTAQGDNTKSASCAVTVTAATVPVTGVTLNKTSTSLYVGGTETLTATVAPDNATDKTVTWTSSNPSVATVENGVVTAVSAGTATITVTTDDGGKTATCTVTVSRYSSGGGSS